jgi:hypothetical protein
MKSSGPVERLLRALGRRDSSRATSRVGVPTSWARVVVGLEVWGVGEGPGFRPDPLPSFLSSAPPSSLGWPEWQGEQQMFVSVDPAVYGSSIAQLETW